MAKRKKRKTTAKQPPPVASVTWTCDGGPIAYRQCLPATAERAIKRRSVPLAPEGRPVQRSPMQIRWQRLCRTVLRRKGLTALQRQHTQAMLRAWTVDWSTAIDARISIVDRVEGFAHGCCEGLVMHGPEGIKEWWQERAWPFIKEHWPQILQLCLSILMMFIL